MTSPASPAPNVVTDVIKRLESLSGLCDPECHGRCGECPAEAVTGAARALRGLPAEPEYVSRIRHFLSMNPADASSQEVVRMIRDALPPQEARRG